MPTIISSPKNLFALSWKQASDFIAELGWPSYRTQQIFQWIYQSRIREIHQMQNLSLKDREKLQSLAFLRRTTQPKILTSEDGTRKLLFAMEDSLKIESVLIPDAHRLTLCLSTQVGCSLDCGFCLTGQMGMKRNLKAHEIVDQVLTTQDYLCKDERISSLVFMGMGEPLANLEELTDAISRLTNAKWGMGIPAKRITISTAGLVSRFQAISKFGVNLAISLNASTNEQRNRLMPAINRLHSLSELIATCREYPLPHGQRITFEYVLLGGENDSPEDAKRVAKLLFGIRCKINLIPFNNWPTSQFKCPTDESIALFQAILRQAKYDVFIRQSRGQDILGACGQLGNLST